MPLVTMHLHAAHAGARDGGPRSDYEPLLLEDMAGRYASAVRAAA